MSHRSTMRARWAMKGAVALLAIGLVACAGETDSASRVSLPSTSAPASPKPADSTGTARQGEDRVTSSGSTATGTKAGSTPSGAAVSSAPFPTAFDVSAKVASACLRSGERQSITITTRPKTPVAYHAQYSDGKDALDPDYYGGNNGGNTDDAGQWTDSWVVAAAAPPGRVKVDVVAQGTDGRGYTQLFFDIADASGRCGP